MAGFLIFFLAIFGAACAPVPAVATSSPESDVQSNAEAVVALVEVTPVPTGLPTETATTVLLAGGSETAVPTITATATNTAEPTATATPHLLEYYTIPSMQEQEFPGGAVSIGRVLEQTGTHTRYYVSYPSDDLTITGLMYVPAGTGPFPVLILLHGYFEREQYYAGADTWQAAEFFAEKGYLVLAPDLRSWGESDAGLSLFHMGLTRDVLNLIGSLSSIPEADPSRVALWGHSMGGGIATKILTIDDRVKAAVLYAPNSADDADLIGRWGPGCLPGQSEAAGDNCNPGEFIPEDTAPEVVEAYLAAAADPIFLRQVAPYYYLENINAPVQIHIGTADGALRTHTPPRWSEKLSVALQDAGKEVTTFTYPGQGHYFTGEGWTSLLERSAALFEQTLMPAP